MRFVERKNFFYDKEIDRRTEARKSSSPGLLISIGSLRDYFDVRHLNNDCPLGTQVTLHLRKSKINYCRSLEYVGYLQSTIRYLDIPVRLNDHRQTILDTHPGSDPKE